MNGFDTVVQRRVLVCLCACGLGLGGVKPASAQWVSVSSTGAKCDGKADDTAAIQAAIAAARSPGGGVEFPATGTCISGNLVVADKSDFTMRSLGATIQWIGSAQAGRYIGIQLAGTLAHVRFDGLLLNGNGTVADGHAGIWNLNGATFTDIVIHRCRITNVVFGAGLAAYNGGSIDGLEMSDNVLNNIVGTEPGTGYGLYHASKADAPAHVRIVNNEISRAQRHSIYQAYGAGVVIATNTIRNHRAGTGLPGSPVSAIVVARSHDVVVAANTIDAAKDGAIEITSADGVATRNVTVAGNVVTNGTGSVAGIVIGNSGPDVNGETSDIFVAGNTIDNDGAQEPQFYLYSGVRINVIGNTFTMLNVPRGATSLFIRGSREGRATATYTNDIRVEDNLFHGTNAAGTYTPIGFGVAAAASTITADFVRNRLVVPGNVFVFDAPQTNPNIHVVDMPATGLRASRLTRQ